MTVSDVLRETAALGFDEAPENMNLFYGALSRAVLTVNRLRPTVRSYTLTHKSPYPAGVYDGYADYDIGTLCKDFLAFAPPVASAEGYRIREGRILSLPTDFAGRVTVFYEPILPTYTEGSEASVIPLPDDLARLLPLLIAASVFLEEDPDRASFWLQSYFTEARAITEKRRPASVEAVTSVDGW